MRTESDTVRIRLRPQTLSSRRSLEDRLAIRFPATMAQLGRAVLVLPLRSRLRQVLVRRFAERGVAAYNRKDYDALLTVYAHDVEVTVNRQMRALGLEPAYHGRDGLRRYHERWTDEWGAWWMAAEEVIDLGDGQMLLLGRVRGEGTTSGAQTDSEFANLTETHRGLVRSERFFFDRAEAYAAAGLDLGA